MDLELKRRNDIVDVSEDLTDVSVKLNRMAAQAVDMFKVARELHQSGNYSEADYYEKMAWDIMMDVENTAMRMHHSTTAFITHWKDK